MTEAIKFHWTARVDALDGEAEFQVGESSIKVHLGSFSEAQGLYLLLRNAYDLGQGVALSRVKAVVSAIPVSGLLR